MSIFITGTDTGVGKTITAGYLLKKYYKEIPSLRYWKPVQTGFPPDDDADTVIKISGAPKDRVIEGIKFRAPVSPHFAAELEHTEIVITSLTESFRLFTKSYSLIIEGAGGVMVPIRRDYLWIDWIEEISIPVLIVARSTLGTINHTLLTAYALKQRNIPVIGIVFCGRHDEPYIHDNRKVIHEITNLPVISYYDINADPFIDVDPDFIVRDYLLS